MTYFEQAMNPDSKLFRSAVVYHKAFKRNWLYREVRGERVHSRTVCSLYEYVTEQVRPLTDDQLQAFNEATLAEA